mgnify:CR=1 FL=1
MKMYRPHRLCPRNSKPKEPSLYRSLCVSILCMFLSTVMLVGTTFAWFYSSATSAVSTITAGGLNVSTSYITQNTALAHRTKVANSETNEVADHYDPIDSLGWVPFSGNGGNPFGSIPFTNDNTSQIIFLKVDNNSSFRTIYRLSLNLLGNISDEAPASNLYYGYQVLGSSVSTESLCNFAIPALVLDSDPHTDVTDNNGKTEQVTSEGFYGDVLSAHGVSADGKTYGGNLCVVDLPVDSGSTKYIAVALYSSDNSSESTDSSSFLVQLSMTVNQFGATKPLMPNVVGSTAVTQQDLEAALSVMYEGFLNEDDPLVVDETNLPEDDPVTNAETPAETGDATLQPPSDTEKKPVPPETTSGSTGEAEPTTPETPADPPAEVKPSGGSTESDTPSNGENLS